MNNMEDTNKSKKIVKIIITFIILLILTVIGAYFYIKKQEEINTSRFEKYINNNNDTDNTHSTYYTVYTNNNILTKTIKIDNNTNSLVTISFNKKNEIKGKLELFGTNKYGNEGISYLESTYKNKKFECKFISNNGYKARCDILKEKTEEFEKEINTIFKKSKTKLKYIKI